MIPREETRRAISTARIYPDLTVPESAFLAGYQVRSRSDFPTRRASSSERAADPHVPLKGTEVPFKGHRSKLIRFLFHARTHTRTRANTHAGRAVARKGRTLGMWLFRLDQLVENKREKEKESIHGSMFVQIWLMSAHTTFYLRHGDQPAGFSMARRRITYAHGFPANSTFSPFLYRVPPAIDSTRGSQADDNPRLRKLRLEILLTFQNFIFAHRIFASRIHSPSYFPIHIIY